jgi:transposase
MSFREFTMMHVMEVLRRWQAGQSARQIARDGVADRKTAARYIEAARARGVEASTALDDRLVAAIAEDVQARAPAPPSAARSALVAQRARIEAWLAGPRPLRLVRVHELLARDGIDVGYTTLRRYAHDELGWRERRASVRIDDAPAGDEAQIDFGEMGLVPTDDGKRRRLWVLVVTLSFSRYMFVWPSFAQTIAAVCEGLDAAWWFFDGVARRLVPDNMSAIVMRADPLQPLLQRAFLEYAQSRGFLVDPARVRRPQDKARVENQIAFVRERWFDGERWSGDIGELRRSAEAWCRDVAGARVHGTTRCIPRDVYAADEKPHMLPAPPTRFDVPVWSTAKIHPDHHASVARALYSLPTRFIGKTLDVRIDLTTVRFYAGRELVKMHSRVEAGRRSTDVADYPIGKADYALRSVDGVKRRASEHGEHVGAFAERLLGGALPWAKLRQAYGLLRLCDRYGRERVDALCARSLAFDVVDVTRIERMLKSAIALEAEATATGKVIALPAGRFARDVSTFATMKGTSPKGGS